MSALDGRSVRATGPAGWAAFPVGVMLVMLILVGLNLNGSSIALLSSDRSAPGLVAGTPRPIRSDEWILRTPIALSSVQQGFPARPWVGLNPNDPAATAHGGPVLEWTTLFKPQDWGYVVLGKSRGLAVSWWWSYAIGLIGCYFLFGLLTRRPLVSAFLSTAAVFTPYTGWWTAPPPALFLGYAALAGASLMAAWKATRRLCAAVWAIAGGLSGVALALALYPPWQVSLGWVVMAVCLGFALDAKIKWRRLLWPPAVAVATAGLLVGLWAVQHRAAIEAQTETYYPGHRISSPGEGSLAALLDAPLNFWMTGDAGATLKATAGDPILNLSEAASTWFPLPVVVLLMIGVLELVLRAACRRWRTRTKSFENASAPETDPIEPNKSIAMSDAPIWTLALVSCSILLLLGWTFLDLPSYVGRVALLDRMPPRRVPLALGFAVLLLVALASQVTRRRPVAWAWPVLGVGAVAAAFATAWSDERLPWDADLTPTALVLLSGFVVGATFAGLVHARVRLVAGLVLAVYAVSSWLLINPLQHGIDPVSQDPLVRRLNDVTEGSENPRVGVFTSPKRSLVTVAKVRAAGLQSLSGTTFYPDASLMRALVPTQENLWNNYAQYIWTAAPPGTAPHIKQIRGTQMSLTLSVCDPILLARTDPGWVVSDQRLDESCLRRASVLQRPGYPRMWIYRVVG